MEAGARPAEIPAIEGAVANVGDAEAPESEASLLWSWTPLRKPRSPREPDRSHASSFPYAIGAALAIMAVVGSFCQTSIVMSMTSMNISLPQDLKEYIEQQTKAGYSTPSEYVRELIRGDRKRRAKERIDALLLEGLGAGLLGRA